MENQLGNEDIICKEVIVSKIGKRGKGIFPDPIRSITQVFEKDGTLIAEYDPFQNHFNSDSLIKFARWLKKKNIDVDNLTNEDFQSFIEATRENYKSQVRCFLEYFMTELEPKAIDIGRLQI